MDADINRWRSIGATKLYFFPNQKPALPSTPRKPAAKPTIDTHAPSQTRAKLRQESLGSLFDRFAQSQRQDVHDYTAGHLNPSKMNLQLQKERDRTKKKALFGKPNDQDEPRDMFDLLEEFDSVKLQQERVRATPATDHSGATLKKLKKPPSDKKSRTFITAPQFSLTRHEQYKAVASVDAHLVQDGRNMRFNDIGKQEKLREYEAFLANELAANECPAKGPHLVRLQIYSQCFEKIIQDFTTYGPLLADIKASDAKEYDNTVSSFRSQEDEFQFLRTKVQKLLSQNENRMMLKFEKQRCRELEDNIAVLEKENVRLKEEMEYKMQVYASYLPRTVLKDQKADAFEYGKDPLSIRDKAIAEKDKLLAEKIKQVEDLKRAQEEEYVPRITKEKLEENFKSLEEKFKIYVEANVGLETELQAKRELVRHLETGLREKEQQYQFLVAEYSELSEGLTKRQSTVASAKTLGVPQSQSHAPDGQQPADKDGQEKLVLE
ncbi:hypothetical protein HDV03_001727 [Kappamyces sp. JEL0829]|nr:hypothetical protein HDV03_001727 [Kappamyces sp. JEL0829]